MEVTHQNNVQDLNQWRCCFEFLWCLRVRGVK